MDRDELPRNKTSGMQPHRGAVGGLAIDLPIILAIIAVCFYGGSIVSIMYGRGGAV